MLNAIRSEAIKIRTVRSPFWLLGIGSLLLLVGALLSGWFIIAVETDNANRFPLLYISFSLCMAMVLVMGSLVITSEYSSKSIRTTFAADPHRVRVIMAKATVAGSLAYVVGLIAFLLAWAFGSLAALIHNGLSIPIDGIGLRILFTGPLLLALGAVLTVGIGTMLRSSAATITITLIWVLVIEGIVTALLQAFAGGVGANITRFLPQSAANVVLGLTAATNGRDGGADLINGVAPFNWWQALAVWIGYAAIAMVGASVLVHRRDA